MKVELEDLVAAMQAMHEAKTGRPSPFHLSGCARCGAPTTGYPCLNCRTWNDYFLPQEEYERERDLERARNAASGVGSRETFVARVGRAGSIALWLLEDRKRVVAWNDPPHREGDQEYTDMIRALIEGAKMVEWPDPGLVWDVVAGEKRSLPDKSHWGAKKDAIDERAKALYGEERLARLKSSSSYERPNWHPWPENCPEGRRVVAELAKETLERLGIAEAFEPTSARLRP